VAVAKVSFSKLCYPKQRYSVEYQPNTRVVASYKEWYKLAPTLPSRAMNKTKNFFPSLLPFNVFFGKWRAILALISFAILALTKMLS
jgi:hypothetical protein